jgi:hypothetical protein
MTAATWKVATSVIQALEEDAAGIFLLFEDRDDAAAARTVAMDGVTRYMTGPVKTRLRISLRRPRCLRPFQKSNPI